MKQSRKIGIMLLIIILIAGSVASDIKEDETKIFMIVIGLYDDILFEETVELEYGHPPNLGHQQGNFTAIVRAANGTALFTFNVWDPRTPFGQYGLEKRMAQHERMEDEEIEKGFNFTSEEEDIDLPLFIPYHQDIRTVELVDKNSGAILLTVNVSPAVTTFCHRFPKDPDMMALISAGIPDVQIHPDNSWIFLGAGCGIAILLLISLIHLVRKK
ncbi:MAG: hypothetical protein M0Q92_06140 [Methanoregula sp.]|jgi:hypothetical protein|nr:hypothetical protein [Methanoregula sp.]